MPREYAWRGKPCLGLPNRDAVKKTTRRKRKQTRFIQQKREYPLSSGGQAAAAEALAHGFSRGKRAPECRAPRVCVARETMPGFTQSGCREKATPRKKKANEVHPTETRIPSLLRRSSSGSRSFSPRLQPWGWGNARRDAVPREKARRGRPCPGLPNRDAVEKATRLKRRQTRFIQQKREYPLSSGGQAAAAAAVSPRLQPWEARAGMPCPARKPGAGNHAGVYPIGMP